MSVIRLPLSLVPIKTTEVKLRPRMFEKREESSADGVPYTTLTRSWHLCAVPEECSACVLAMVQGLEPQETSS